MHYDDDLVLSEAGADDEYFATGEMYEVGDDDGWDDEVDTGFYEIGADEDLSPEEAEELLDALAAGDDDDDDDDYEVGARRGAGFLRRLMKRARRGRTRPRRRARRRTRRGLPARRRAPSRMIVQRRPSPGRGIIMPGAPGGLVRVKQTRPTEGRLLWLGFDSGAVIPSLGTATISEQPQDIFRARRVIIPASLAPQFVINDIKVGNISQLSSSGAIPGEAFAPETTYTDVRFDTAQVSQQITFLVQNVSGANVRFRAAMLGYVARQ